MTIDPNADERAEIEADLFQQGVDTTVDDVIGSYSLFKTMQPYGMDSEAPRPAFGADWRYVPQPGEEELFADTGDMFFPPAAPPE